MSIDFDELAAHLDTQRRKDAKSQYEERSTHATTAFLLCFFMGYLGAHRFYLGQWRSGLAHLVIFALGAVCLIAGFLSGTPMNAALYVIGGVLILASLIWEIIDLGRIDGEIHHRNLLLAEGLIAGALLADPTPVQAAAQKLDSAVQKAAAQSRAASVDPAATMPGMISAAELAQARSLAEQSGSASISYQEVTNFDVSATPEERAGETQVAEPTTTTERHVNTAPLPANAEGAPAMEAQTHIHTEDGYRVTDAQETDRITGPSAAEVIGMGAAALGVAGAGYAATEAAHAAPVPAEPVAAETVAPATPPVDELATTPIPPQASAAPTPRMGSDVTDAGAPSHFEPAADVAFGSSYPGYIALPEEPTAPVSGASASYGEPTAPGATDATAEAEVPLYFSPDETVPTATEPATPEPAAESYVPPVPDVYSAPTPQPQTYTPSWEEQTPPAAAPTSTSESHVAEVAGLGALAGAGALAADEWAHHNAEPATAEPAPVEPVASVPVAAEPVPTEQVATAPVASAPAAAEPAAPESAAVAEPAAPKMKRIRVKHRIVVEGQVVREEIVEREVPADADMALAVKQIQEELEQSASATPDEIARMANLTGDEEVEVRRHVEGLGQ